MKKKDFKHLHQKVNKLQKKALKNLEEKHGQALRHLEKKGLSFPEIRKFSLSFLIGAGLTAAVLMALPEHLQPKVIAKQVQERVHLKFMAEEEIKKFMAEKVADLLPGAIGKITGADRDKICQLFERILKVDVCFNLEGKELNFSFGWIGYEQHLKRYPGDTLSQHDEEQVAGIAPGLGAWGYFAPSKEEMTEELYQMEKYYVAVQTMYLPEWYTQTKELSQWYKHRKVMVVNTETGQACVAVVADAGPASWTGKQFGGSPEVMKELDLHLGPRKGKVLLFFVDDPDNKVPLGPIRYN